MVQRKAKQAEEVEETEKVEEYAATATIVWDKGNIKVDTNLSPIGAIHLMALATQMLVEQTTNKVANEEIQ